MSLTIPLTPVESTRIKGIGYDAMTSTMAVEFPRAAVYHYFDVPQKVFADFLAAESKGKFFEASIRGAYRYEKQVPVEAKDEPSAEAA